MNAEILIGALFAASGFAALSPVGRAVPAAARMWLSIPIGVSLYLVAALVLIVITGTLDPPVALGLAVAMAGVGPVVARLRGGPTRWDLKQGAWAVGIAIATVVIVRLVHLTRLTPDSLRYLLGATDLALPDALEEFNRADLINRQIGLPSLHALAELVDRRYMASVAPLFGVSGLGLFVWLSRQFTMHMETRRRRWLVVSALLFLGASNRLVYDSFYINTHIQMAVYLLISVSGAWLAVARGQTGWALPAGVALGSTLLLRPEAPIMVAVILVSVAASKAGWPVRIGLALPPTVVTSIWYGLVLWNHARGGDEVSVTAPVFGSLVAVVGAVLLVIVGGTKRGKSIVGPTDWLMLAGLVVLLVTYGAASPDFVVRSAQAAFHNLTRDGLWLLTWVAALPLLALALIIRRGRDSRLWTVPILGFGILWWLLPLIRGGAYRVGSGDSGNRILAHILPVVVAFLVLAGSEVSAARTAEAALPARAE